MLNYIPLSKENIDNALSVANTIFPNDIQTIDRAYHISLDPDHPRWQERYVLEYYLVEHQKEGVVGITGLYQHTTHPKGEVWLGWYGVLPTSRGKGYGQKILEWTMNLAINRGYRKLNLWTTSSPDENVAQKLYDKLGFHIYKTEQEAGSEYIIMYRTKDLGL